MAGTATKAFGIFCALAAGSVLRHVDAPDEAPAKEEGARVVAAPRSPWSVDRPRTAAGVPAGPAAISRDSSGTFHVEGAINGNVVNMIVDTGAVVVAIPSERAADFGIYVNPGDFEPIARTASGTANAARVSIESLVIGDTELRHVDAMVVEGLDVVLLGQSALSQLGQLRIHGDRMDIVSSD